MRPCSRKRPTIDLTRMLSDRPGTPGLQAADAAHDEIDLHAGLARIVERVDDLRDRPASCTCIQIAAGRPALACSISSSIWSRRRCLQRQRRDRHALELGRLGIAGDEVEDARHVARDHRIGGEEGQVRVDARRDRVVIAGADMAVGDELPGLAPHHQRQLGVGLQLDEAEHHLRAGALEVARPADVGLLVEARLELDERGDRLAGLRRLGQRLDDRADSDEVR